MVEVIVDEFGPDEFIARIGDPIWFQTLGALCWPLTGMPPDLQQS
jgi:hypothetical protein